MFYEMLRIKLAKFIGESLNCRPLNYTTNQ